MSDPCRVQIAKYGTYMGTGKMTKLEADFAKVVAVSAERGPHGG